MLVGHALLRHKVGELTAGLVARLIGVWLAIWACAYHRAGSAQSNTRVCLTR